MRLLLSKWLRKPKRITLTSGELAIAKNLEIERPGAALLTIWGNKASRDHRLPTQGTCVPGGLLTARRSPPRPGSGQGRADARPVQQDNRGALFGKPAVRLAH